MSTIIPALEASNFRARARRIIADGFGPLEQRLRAAREQQDELDRLNSALWNSTGQCSAPCGQCSAPWGGALGYLTGGLAQELLGFPFL